MIIYQLKKLDRRKLIENRERKRKIQIEIKKYQIIKKKKR
jgi:hypothetical protein